MLKHADVDEAVASLTVDRQHLTAVVRDNGPGFDVDKVLASLESFSDVR